MAAVIHRLGSDSLPVPSPPRLARPNDMSVMWKADDAGLAQSEYRVFARVYRRYNLERGCDESVPSIADGCRMHADTARDALARLVELGMLRATKRPGRPTRYDVLAPSHWTPLGKEGRGDPSETEGVPPIHPSETEGGDPSETEGDEVNPQVNTDDEDGAAGARAREGSAEVRLDELTPEARRYRRQVEAYLAAGATRRRQIAYAAWKAGNTPGAEVARALDEAEARAGPVAVGAALAITAEKARARYAPERISHFHSVLSQIEDHARRSRLQPEPAGAGGTAEGAGAPPAGRGAPDAPGGGRNARERASHLTAADVRRTGDEALALLRGLRGGPDPAA